MMFVDFYFLICLPHLRLESSVHLRWSNVCQPWVVPKCIHLTSRPGDRRYIYTEGGIITLVRQMLVTKGQTCSSFGHVHGVSSLEGFTFDISPSTEAIKSKVGLCDMLDHVALWFWGLRIPSVLVIALFHGCCLSVGSGGELKWLAELSCNGSQRMRKVSFDLGAWKYRRFSDGLVVLRSDVSGSMLFAGRFLGLKPTDTRLLKPNWKQNECLVISQSCRLTFLFLVR